MCYLFIFNNTYTYDISTEENNSYIFVFDNDKIQQIIYATVSIPSYTHLIIYKQIIILVINWKSQKVYYLTQQLLFSLFHLHLSLSILHNVLFNAVQSNIIHIIIFPTLISKQLVFFLYCFLFDSSHVVVGN